MVDHGWQRDRERFSLMKTALEKGVTRFPGTPPYWLVSLRQGVTLSAVGIGLVGAGGGALVAGPQRPNGNLFRFGISPSASFQTAK